MQPFDNLAGRLRLSLRYSNEAGVCCVKHVDIRSSRLRLSSRFFEGKPVALAPKLVGTLFSLCGTAQAVASARACGEAADAATEHQRDALVSIETLFEHLLRLSQDWPAALANEPIPAQELQVLFKLKRELVQAPNPAVMDDIQQWFEAHLLGLPLARWLDYCARGDAPKLSLRGEIGNLMTSLCRYAWEPLGNAELHPLPALPPAWWLERLDASDAAQFSATPTLDGQACETSSLTRQWDNPALQVWRKKYGSGLMTRLIARVLDMLECWQSLLSSLLPPSPLAGEGLGMGGKGNAEGISTLQTARGLLTHRVVQHHGLIQHYQIVAPTEWNFHPQGSLYQMLSGLQAAHEAELRRQAQALITALDPCVAYQLEITPDA